MELFVVLYLKSSSSVRIALFADIENFFLLISEKQA